MVVLHGLLSDSLWQKLIIFHQFQTVEPPHPRHHQRIGDRISVVEEDGDRIAGIRGGSGQRESMALIIAMIMITIIDGVPLGLDKDGNHLVGAAEVIKRADFARPAALGVADVLSTVGKIAVALG